jgi:hypothetical protein
MTWMQKTTSKLIEIPKSPTSSLYKFFFINDLPIKLQNSSRNAAYATKKELLPALPKLGARDNATNAVRYSSAF